MTKKYVSNRTNAAVLKYGLAVVERAFKLHSKDGEGASTVGIYLGLTTGQANAAINAGRELAEFSASKGDIVIRQSSRPEAAAYFVRIDAGNVPHFGSKEEAARFKYVRFAQDYATVFVRIPLAEVMIEDLSVE